MADVQIENGYTKIANDLMLAFCKAGLSGSEYMIALTVLSKTYGWNKKYDYISISQFMRLTLLDRQTVIRATKKLVSKMILGSTKDDTSVITKYCINKDYDRWDLVAKMIPSGQNDTLGSVKNDTRGVAKKKALYYTKDILTKDKNTKHLFDFESLWTKYPNKDGKKQAQRHFKNTVKNQEDYINISKAIENYLGSERVKKGFIKNGSTWFNNWQDWLNYIEPAYVVNEQEALERKAGLRHDPSSRKRSYNEE